MKKLTKAMVCLMLVLAMLAVPAVPSAAPGAGLHTPGTVTAEAAVKKVVKKSKGYYSNLKKTGYWADKKYKTNGLKRIYKFDASHYMSKSKYNKMVKALKSKSYKKLKSAIGKGKRIKKSRSCSGGKWDYIYRYGTIDVYVTDGTIRYID